MMCNATLCSAVAWLLSAMLRYGLQVVAIVIALMVASASADARTPMCVTASTPTKHMCDSYGGAWGATALPPSWSEVTPEYPSKVALASLTEAKILSLVKTKRVQLELLRDIETVNGLPTGTLRTKWFIESRAGERNIRNRSGYEGNFQVGDYEAKRYGITNRRDLKDSAAGVVRLLKDYSAKSGIPLTTVFDAYSLHQQGFNGAVNIRNASIAGSPLRPDVKRNMLSNLPKQVLRSIHTKDGKLLLNDQALAKKFRSVWKSEVARINNVIITAMGY